MRVFRLEHKKTGRGPYQSMYWSYMGLNKDQQDLLDIMKIEHAAAEKTPPPLCEGVGTPIYLHWLKRHGSFEGYVFGFLSTNQLNNWFDGWLSYLFEMGFVVREYESNDVLIGDYQVAFVKPIK